VRLELLMLACQPFRDCLLEIPDCIAADRQHVL